MAGRCCCYDETHTEEEKEAHEPNKENQKCHTAYKCTQQLHCKYFGMHCIAVFLRRILYHINSIANNIK